MLSTIPTTAVPQTSSSPPSAQLSHPVSAFPSHWSADSSHFLHSSCATRGLRFIPSFPRKTPQLTWNAQPTQPPSVTSFRIGIKFRSHLIVSPFLQFLITYMSVCLCVVCAHECNTYTGQQRKCLDFPLLDWSCRQL